MEITPTPVYCSACGKKLIEAEVREDGGYDIYTGEKLTIVTGLLVCPKYNPKKPASEKERKNYVAHDKYETSSEIVED